MVVAFPFGFVVPDTTRRNRSTTGRFPAKIASVRDDQVLRVLDQLLAETTVAWIDGGWGIDALLEHQTRDHADLDLVIDAAAIPRVKSALLAEGFEVVRDWLPTAIAFEHPDGRAIDLHPVELTPDGGGDQIQLDGKSRFHYAAPTFGRICDRVVPCCTVETQIASHLGYEPQQQDYADMGALAAKFGYVLPPPYDRG
jgi:lincosamide nucleotidyltransferase A/C/D/E